MSSDYNVQYKSELLASALSYRRAFRKCLSEYDLACADRDAVKTELANARADAKAFEEGMQAAVLKAVRAKKPFKTDEKEIAKSGDLQRRITALQTVSDEKDAIALTALHQIDPAERKYASAVICAITDYRDSKIKNVRNSFLAMTNDLAEIAACDPAIHRVRSHLTRSDNVRDSIFAAVTQSPQHGGKRFEHFSSEKLVHKLLNDLPARFQLSVSDRARFKELTETLADDLSVVMFDSLFNQPHQPDDLVG